MWIDGPQPTDGVLKSVVVVRYVTTHALIPIRLLGNQDVEQLGKQLVVHGYRLMPHNSIRSCPAV